MERWRRKNSVPTSMEYFREHDEGIDLESSLPIYLEEQQIRRTVIFPGGRKQKSSVSEEPATTELSTDNNSPGVLKIFGDTIVPGVEYKSVLASYRSTAKELVKESLERYGLPASLHDQFVLCDVAGICNSGVSSESDHSNAKRQQKWSRACLRVISDFDRPLLLQNFWKPADGFSRRYELRRKSEFLDLPSEDDTFGLNENARKISISKLRRGAIPFFASWKDGKLDNFANELNLEGTYTRLRTPWMVKKNECNKLINGLNLDTSLDTSVSSLQSMTQYKKHNSDYYTAPVSRPFLLTLRGFDPERDPVLHVLDTKTVLVCNAYEFSPNTNYIGLYAPDIQQKECHINVRRLTSQQMNSIKSLYNYCVEVDCLSSSNVKINSYPVTRRTTMKCGDILTIGNHYVFMFKDLTSGQDVPMDIPWMRMLEYNEDGFEEEQNYIKDKRKQHVVHVPPLMLGGSNDDNLSVSTTESNSESARERFRFAYSREKEEEMIKSIGSVIRQNYVEFPLAPTYLYAMCIEYACQQFEGFQIRNLLLRILVVVRESVAELSKALQNNKFNCGLIKSRRHPSVGEDYLRCLLRWMSNCVQLILFLKSYNIRKRFNKKINNDDALAAISELASGLEEIVVFCFQQTIYTITKALYLLLPAVLDSNPFLDQSDLDKRSGVWKIITILDYIARLSNSQHLHTEVIKQLYMYLFFFCSTSIFNRLFLKESGCTYYNWSAGVRIRANLGEIEEWAARNGMDEEFGHLFEKLLTAAEFLSTSKSLLLKYDWMNMKAHFSPLNEAQLHRLLTGYHLSGRSAPYSWQPTPEDRLSAMQEEDILLEMSGHPPFILPQEDGNINLLHPPDDAEFWSYFKHLHNQYGIMEDDSDSSFHPSQTPHSTVNFPKVELQKSFFRQSSTSSSVFSHKEARVTPRKVQFADTDSNQTTPRDIGENTSSSSDISSNRDSTINTRVSESVNKRLDQLITNTSMATNSVTNIRCLSPPPPIPPRAAPRDSIQVKPSRRNTSRNSTEKDKSTSQPKSDIRPIIKTRAHDVSAVTTEPANMNVPNEHLSGQNGDYLDEDVVPKELLIEVNKQLLETQHRRVTSSSMSSNSDLSGPLSPMSDVFCDPLPQDISPRTKNAPVFSVNISKGEKGLGLGLIDGLFTPLRLAGIYIRKILPESPAADNGQIGVGDRLLCVNGKSIVGADYQSAMKLIRASGNNLTLLVAKGNESVASKVTSTEC